MRMFVWVMSVLLLAEVVCGVLNLHFGRPITRGDRVASLISNLAIAVWGVWLLGTTS